MGQYISFDNDYQDLFGCADTPLHNSTPDSSDSKLEPRSERTLEPELFVSDHAPILSKDSKIELTNILLRNEIDNRKMDDLRHAQHDCLCKHIFDSLNQNIYELSQENKMLRESLERYKKMYFDQLPSSSESDD